MHGLDPDRLDVYRVALAHRRRVALHARGISAALRSQLVRASDSVVLNTAEACGRAHRRDRCQFFAIARGSAFECSAAWDILLVQGAIEEADYRVVQKLLVRVVQMLTKLARP